MQITHFTYEQSKRKAYTLKSNLSALLLFVIVNIVVEESFYFSTLDLKKAGPNLGTQHRL